MDKTEDSPIQWEIRPGGDDWTRCSIAGGEVDVATHGKLAVAAKTDASLFGLGVYGMTPEISGRKSASLTTFCFTVLHSFVGLLDSVPMCLILYKCNYSMVELDKSRRWKEPLILRRSL